MDTTTYEKPGPVESEWSDAISSIEEIIEDARNGRMFILVDHEDRENEGDLVIPAQMATPEAINFMATHGRGLICLSMTGTRVDQLGLPLMASQNSSRHETAFTVSIEAREGVSTGISAHDRARTVAVAIDAVLDLVVIDSADAEHGRPGRGQARADPPSRSTPRQRKARTTGSMSGATAAARKRSQSPSQNPRPNRKIRVMAISTSGVVRATPSQGSLANVGMNWLRLLV